MSDFENSIYHPYISAFRRQHSCQSVLLRLTEDWRVALDNGNLIGTVLMDLSKAFDSMPISLLVSKLDAYGMNMEAIRLLTSYLTERTQRVKVSDKYSDWLVTVKGVPQGSVLGPTLFNVFMNDIYGFIKKANLFNYADDNTLGYVGKSTHEITDVLTEESEIAIDWFYFNMMEANPDKFQAMLLSKPSQNKDFSLRIGSNFLKTESCVKLLGINIDKHMNFNYHVEKLCIKAARQLNALSRVQRHLDSESKFAIVRAFIMSNFSYCPVIWHFCNRKSTHRMESIMRRALRMACNDFVSDYETLLTMNNLCTLEVQRQKCFAVEVFKILHNMSPVYLDDLVKTNAVSVHDTRQKFNLRVPSVKSTTYGLHSFRSFSTKIWNSLPNACKIESSLENFKRSLSGWKGFTCKCNLCRF